MTKARDTANIVGGGFSGTIAGATMEPTGDTAAGDNAAIGFTSAEGLIITGQGSTGDVTIKNDADALVAHVPTGTTGVNFAGDVIVPDGDLILGSTAVTATGAEINLIDGGTSRGTTAIADGDGVLVNDAGTMRMTNVTTLATYMGTKITGGSLVFIASSGAISNAATVDFTQFDSTAYDSYEFAFIEILPATDDVELRALTSSDTSSHSYDTGSSDYLTPFDGTSTSAFGQVIHTGSPFSNVANEGFSGSIRIWNPHTSFYTLVSPIGGVYTVPNGNAYGAQYYTFGFKRKEAAQVNAIRFFFESGNIASGEIVMYGIANGS